MGAKTGTLIFSDGDAPAALRRAQTVDDSATADLLQRVHPGARVEPDEGMPLTEATYPPDGVCYAASFTDVDVVCDRRLMGRRPTLL